MFSLIGPQRQDSGVSSVAKKRFFRSINNRLTGNAISLEPNFVSIFGGRPVSHLKLLRPLVSLYPSKNKLLLENAILCIFKCIGVCIRHFGKLKLYPFFGKLAIKVPHAEVPLKLFSFTSSICRQKTNGQELNVWDRNR